MHKKYQNKHNHLYKVKEYQHKNNYLYKVKEYQHKHNRHYKGREVYDRHEKFFLNVKGGLRPHSADAVPAPSLSRRRSVQRSPPRLLLGRAWASWLTQPSSSCAAENGVRL